ncbi:hypothetical protein ACVU7I_06500, partial [Patulibacter sp. S7RM1-6]
MPAVPPPPDAWSGLIARLGDDADWRTRAVDAVVAAIVRERPALDADPELAAALRASVDDNARLFVALARAELDVAGARLPAAAAAFVRLLVHRGVPVETLTLTYRVAHRAFWRAWVGELRGAVAEPAGLAAALEHGATSMFAFVDALGAEAQALYAEERGRWVRSADAVRGETIRGLLSGASVDPATAGRRLRYDLEREPLALVAWTPGPAPGPALTGALRALVA